MKTTLKTCVTLMLSLALTLTLVACGNNGNQAPVDNGGATQPPQAEETVQLSKFEQFEKALTDKGIQFEVTGKAASMVGAAEGYGYSFEDETSVELYLFDKTSDAYKEAFKSSKLNLAAFSITMDVDFNDDICIYYNGELTNKADIKAIFDHLK